LLLCQISFFNDERYFYGIKYEVVAILVLPLYLKIISVFTSHEEK